MWCKKQPLDFRKIPEIRNQKSNLKGHRQKEESNLDMSEYLQEK